MDVYDRLVDAAREAKDDASQRTRSLIKAHGEYLKALTSDDDYDTSWEDRMQAAAKVSYEAGVTLRAAMLTRLKARRRDETKEAS